MPRALKTRVAKLQKLAAAADAHEVEIPGLGPYRGELETALEEVVSTKNRQDSLKRLLQEVRRELREQMASATEAGTRLKYLVRASFGRKDERLADFGMKIVGRPRKPPQAERRRNGSPGYH